jgi:hypothetical protein
VITADTIKALIAKREQDRADMIATYDALELQLRMIDGGLFELRRLLEQCESPAPPAQRLDTIELQ